MNNEAISFYKIKEEELLSKDISAGRITFTLDGKNIYLDLHEEGFDPPQRIKMGVGKLDKFNNEIFNDYSTNRVNYLNNTNNKFTVKLLQTFVGEQGFTVLFETSKETEIKQFPLGQYLLTNKDENSKTISINNGQEQTFQDNFAFELYENQDIIIPSNVQVARNNKNKFYTTVFEDGSETYYTQKCYPKSLYNQLQDLGQIEEENPSLYKKNIITQWVSIDEYEELKTDLILYDDKPHKLIYIGTFNGPDSETVNSNKNYNIYYLEPNTEIIFDSNGIKEFTTYSIMTHVEGSNNQVFGNTSHCGGNNNQVLGNSILVNGENNKALSNFSSALGKNNIAFGLRAHAQGLNTLAYGENSFTFGLGEALGEQENINTINLISRILKAHDNEKLLCAYGANDLVGGNKTSVIGNNSIGSGELNLLLCDNSFITGYNNNIGLNNQTIFKNNIISGNENHGTMINSIINGSQNNVFGVTNSYVNGQNLYISGMNFVQVTIEDLPTDWDNLYYNYYYEDENHTFHQYQNSEIKIYTNTEGTEQTNNNFNIYRIETDIEEETSPIKINNSIFFGNNNYINSNEKIISNSIIGGNEQKITNSFINNSILFGNDNYINSNEIISNSIVGGNKQEITNSSIKNSILFGSNNLISDNDVENVVVIGKGLQVDQSFQTVFGQYNKIENNLRFSIGCGTSEKRENAFEVYDNGDVRIPNPGTHANSIMTRSAYSETVATKKIRCIVQINGFKTITHAGASPRQKAYYYAGSTKNGVTYTYTANFRYSSLGNYGSQIWGRIVADQNSIKLRDFPYVVCSIWILEEDYSLIRTNNNAMAPLIYGTIQYPSASYTNLLPQLQIGSWFNGYCIDGQTFNNQEFYSSFKIDGTEYKMSKSLSNGEEKIINDQNAKINNQKAKLLGSLVLTSDYPKDSNHAYPDEYSQYINFQMIIPKG